MMLQRASRSSPAFHDRLGRDASEAEVDTR
jgi:hypothetical protein